MKLRTLVRNTAVALALLTSAATAQQIDPTKLKPGFIMNFYPITDTARPDQPRGRPIASLIYNEGFPISYYKPFDMQSALNKYRDNWWLLVFQGYLNLADNGDYTFATTLMSDDNDSARYHATCGSELLLNGVSVNKVPIEQFYKTRNAYKDIPLAAGLYPITIKYFCIGRRSPDTFPQFELAVRGPRDPILAPFSAKNVYHLAQ